MATRRQVIASAGTLLAGGAAVAATGTASAQTDVEFDVPDRVEFDSDEGRLQYLRVSPSYNINYQGFSEAPERARVRLFATVGGKTRQLSNVNNGDLSGTEGNLSGSLPESDLVHVFGDDTFTTGTTTVRFRLQVLFNNGVEGEETAEVDVVVNDSGNSSDVDVGGSLTFDGEGA